MILGSDTLKPIIRELLPEAEIVSRPRFSTLRYAGSVKLSRLPPRSAVVAFSAEQVYALAEMLRRFKGGAAVVMGALSPATRNAQVAMFQRGEVDYLVATDAIGMGLNMDVTHVAFAGLEKFDGRRDRRLTIAEMAQIAGRAGRHQQRRQLRHARPRRRRARGFSDEEINAIEEHRFRPLDFVYWRNAELDFTDVRALIASLEARSDDPLLRPAPEAIDLAVLKLIAEDPAIAAKRGAAARRLWAACGLPDFRKVGPMHHARMVRRLFSYIGEGGHIPHEWFAAEVARLDNVERRHRGARRPPRRHPQLGLYRPPLRLAGRSGQMGRAHARGRRRGCQRRAPRAADPALRRPPHRGAGARYRRARRRRACR